MNRKKGFRDIRVILLYCCLIFLGSLLVNTSTVEAAFTVNVVEATVSRSPWVTDGSSRKTTPMWPSRESR
jgi:hypothetical protein